MFQRGRVWTFASCVLYTCFYILNIIKQSQYQFWSNKKMSTVIADGKLCTLHSYLPIQTLFLVTG